jgi:hypothetical protein
MTEASADFRVLALQLWGFVVGEPIPCVLCSRGGNWGLHHYILKSQGGSDEPDNLLPLCGGEDSCHDAVHAEEIEVLWRDGIVYRVENGETTAETPWPPHPTALDDFYGFMSTAIQNTEWAGETLPHLIAPLLGPAAEAMQDLGNEVQKNLEATAYLRLQRAPKRGRTQAAKDVAQEWSDQGIAHVSEATVRNLAGRYRLRAVLPEEVFRETPDSILNYASYQTPPEDEDVIHAWHDRLPGQGVAVFIRGQQAAKKDPEQVENVCETCAGTGKCETCSGTGREP